MKTIKLDLVNMGQFTLDIEQKVIHTYYGTIVISADTKEQAIEIFDKLSQSERLELFEDNLEDGGISGTGDIKLS